MGLDMRPIGKAKEGLESRFDELFAILKNNKEIDGKEREKLLAEWFSIQLASYETIKAPKIGRDTEADEWIRNQYKESDQSVPENEYIKSADGCYVLELAKEIDGIPVYQSIGQDLNIFRGEFLNDCISLIGEDLVAEAWVSKSAKETLDYGNRLMNEADKIASAKKLQVLKDQRNPPGLKEKKIVRKLHIIYSLAKWLIFYGRNGHGYQADF
jgi:hypothetical protein